MNDFDAFMTDGAVDGSEDTGELVTINGQTIKGTFDEFDMTVKAMSFGDKEGISASCVIPSALLDSIPAQKDKLVRVQDGVEYRVISVNNDSGHVDLRLQRIGKKQSNGA